MIRAWWFVVACLLLPALATAQTHYTRSVSESLTLTPLTASPAGSAVSILELATSSDAVGSILAHPPGHYTPTASEALSAADALALTVTKPRTGAADGITFSDAVARVKNGTGLYSANPAEALTLADALAPAVTKPRTGAPDAVVIADAVVAVFNHAHRRKAVVVQ